MNKYFLLITFSILMSNTSIGREFTKPPSIALRSEVSYVAEVVLVQKEFVKKSKQWQLNFSLLNNIHNKSKDNIEIIVNQSLASNLMPKEKYIIAYQTHRKAKVDGVSKYLPIKNGTQLVSVQGADPAIFNINKQLKKQLTTDPELAKSNPKMLIKMIMIGIMDIDPKIQEFFVRELINWPGLTAQLSKTDTDKLLAVFLDNNASVGTLVAFLENRQDVHSALGVNEMASKVIQLLNNIPVESLNDSKIPTLIYTSLSYLKLHELGDWGIYKRWLRSDNPAITELALLQMDKINTTKTLSAVQTRMQETLIPETSRRIFNRYLLKQRKD